MAPVSDVNVNVDMEVSDRGETGRRGGVLSLEDCCCPVCLEIFMEPVTLPCTHTFCKGCFLESVDKATLCCPLCRKRVSTWARLNSRNNTLINQQLWTQIQTAFPLQCQRRLSGQEVIAEDGPAVSMFFPRVSQPGELRQEYEDQVTKLTEEKRVFDEEERRASEEYIQRLLAEEEELLEEERRRRKDDERLAKLLSNQLNSAAVPQENPRPPDITPAKKKKKEAVTAGQIDRFLSPRPSKSSSSDGSFTANKENILVSLQAERSPPRLDYYGDGSADPDLHPASPSASMEDPPPPTRDARSSSTKRKNSELETPEDEETKRVCHSLPSSSSSLEGGGSVLQGVAEREMELVSRQQQEEEDWRLAQLLQRQLDQEEKHRATDRRKGSLDAYQLRQNRMEKVEAGGAETPSRASRKMAKTSISSSSTPPVKAAKTFTNSTPPVKAAKTSRSSSTPPVKTTKTSRSSSTPVKAAKTSRSSSTPPVKAAKTSRSSSTLPVKTTKTSRSSSTPPVKTTKNSTPSSSAPSSSSSSRGSKQTTLTEMFSSLSS